VVEPGWRRLQLQLGQRPDDAGEALQANTAHQRSAWHSHEGERPQFQGDMWVTFHRGYMTVPGAHQATSTEPPPPPKLSHPLRQRAQCATCLWAEWLSCKRMKYPPVVFGCPSCGSLTAGTGPTTPCLHSTQHSTSCSKRSNRHMRATPLPCHAHTAVIVLPHSRYLSQLPVQYCAVLHACPINSPVHL
jgi:hypothetical protein